MSVVLAVVLANLVLVSLLAAATAARKWHRDLAEAQIAEKRRKVRSGSTSTLRSCILKARRSLTLQVELAVAFPGFSASKRRDVVAAARATGLVACLVTETGDRRPHRRGIALRLLGELQDQGSLPIFVQGLRDRDPDVRVVAAGALAQLGGSLAAEALLDALRDSALAPERIVERLAAPWAVEVILRRLESEPNEQRAHLARALGFIGDVRASPALVAMLQTGQREERIAAARALGTCGTKRCVLALRQSLRDDDWEVAAQSATSLGQLSAIDAVEDLEALLTSHSWWVRANAASALANLGERGATALGRAQTSPDRYARERAAEVVTLTGLRFRDEALA